MTSVERLSSLSQAQAMDEAAADQAVYELYGLTSEQRDLVNAEFS